jgi:hypothetical protein
LAVDRSLAVSRLGLILAIDAPRSHAGGGLAWSVRRAAAGEQGHEHNSIDEHSHRYRAPSIERPDCRQKQRSSWRPDDWVAARTYAGRQMGVPAGTYSRIVATIVAFLLDGFTPPDNVPLKPGVDSKTPVP